MRKNVIQKDDTNKIDCNYCVVCGAVVPEGRLVCPTCEEIATAAHDDIYRERKKKKGAYCSHVVFIKVPD